MEFYHWFPSCELVITGFFAGIGFMIYWCMFKVNCRKPLMPEQVWIRTLSRLFFSDLWTQNNAVAAGHNALENQSNLFDYRDLYPVFLFFSKLRNSFRHSFFLRLINFYRTINKFNTSVIIFSQFFDRPLQCLHFFYNLFPKSSVSAFSVF